MPQSSTSMFYHISKKDTVIYSTNGLLQMSLDEHWYNAVTPFKQMLSRGYFFQPVPKNLVLILFIPKNFNLHTAHMNQKGKRHIFPEESPSYLCQYWIYPASEGFLLCKLSLHWEKKKKQKTVNGKSYLVLFLFLKKIHGIHLKSKVCSSRY